MAPGEFGGGGTSAALLCSMLPTHVLDHPSFLLVIFSLVMALVCCRLKILENILVGDELRIMGV